MIWIPSNHKSTKYLIGKVKFDQRGKSCWNVGDIKKLKKLECPYNDTTNGELSTLISFEVSVQELIDLVELLLKCSTYFAQGLIEISNLYEMSIEVEWKVSFKLINLKFGSTLKASVEWKRNPSRSRGQITPTTIWFAWLTKDNAMVGSSDL